MLWWGTIWFEPLKATAHIFVHCGYTGLQVIYCILMYSVPFQKIYPPETRCDRLIRCPQGPRPLQPRQLGNIPRETRGCGGTGGGVSDQETLNAKVAILITRVQSHYLQV